MLNHHCLIALYQIPVSYTTLLCKQQFFGNLLTCNSSKLQFFGKMPRTPSRVHCSKWTIAYFRIVLPKTVPCIYQFVYVYGSDSGGILVSYYLLLTECRMDHPGIMRWPVLLHLSCKHTHMSESNMHHMTILVPISIFFYL